MQYRPGMHRQVTSSNSVLSICKSVFGFAENGGRVFLFTTSRGRSRASRLSKARMLQHQPASTSNRTGTRNATPLRLRGRRAKANAGKLLLAGDTSSTRQSVPASAYAFRRFKAGKRQTEHKREYRMQILLFEIL